MLINVFDWLKFVIVDSCGILVKISLLMLSEGQIVLSLSYFSHYSKFFSSRCCCLVNCYLDPIMLLTETHTPRPAQSPATFTPLAFSELPSSGDLVGIDAEFGILTQEETEVRSDGTHTTVKPSQYSVARITTIRG